MVLWILFCLAISTGLAILTTKVRGPPEEATPEMAAYNKVKESPGPVAQRSERQSYKLGAVRFDSDRGHSMIVKNESLLDEFRTAGYCECCGKKCRRREPAHLFAKGIGGGSRQDMRINLIALGSTLGMCCPCHTKSHADGGVLNLQFIEIISERDGESKDDILSVMYLIRRLSKPTKSEIEEAVESLHESAKQLAIKELKEAGVLS